MRRPTPHEARLHRHGDIFSPHAGSMIIHAQRENGLARRSITLAAWQVQVLRFFTSRWVFLALAAALITWGYFAVQAARVPFLLIRMEQMEQDAARLDSLRRTVTLLQRRYDQVQRMLAASTGRSGQEQKTPPTDASRAPSNVSRPTPTEAEKKPPN